jgi:hypothetical protein
VHQSGSGTYAIRNCRVQTLLGILGFLVAGTTLDTLGNWAVDVVVGNPAGVVRLVGTSRNALAARQRLALNNLGLLRSSGLLGLGEEGFDVCLVDEVGGTSESSTEDEVQEDASSYPC